MTVADVLASGDQDLIDQTKALVSDPEAAKAAADARVKLENYVSPFGGVATITALDILTLATKAGRSLEGTTITDVSVLGTEDLSKTNKDFIDKLSGDIQGQSDLTFSADSNVMVFKFKLDGAAKISKTLSYLSGNQEIYQKDANGNLVLDANNNKQLTTTAKGVKAGHASDQYDKYLKYVSYYDLEQYGASATNNKDDKGNVLFGWDLEATENDPDNPGQTRNKVRTADGAALTTLTGEVIDRAGWYDFTQQTDGGDGARYLKNEEGRIIGVELNFTANMFGDKTPGDDEITDPGATVAAVSVGNGQIEDNETAIDTDELAALRAKAEQATEAGLGAGTGVTTEAGKKLVDEDAQILEAGQVAINASDLPEGIDLTNLKLVDKNAVILGNGQISVDQNSIILKDNEFITTNPNAEEQNQQSTKDRKEIVIEDFSGMGTGPGVDEAGNSNLVGVDDAGTGEGMAAMTLGSGTGSGVGPGATDNTSNSSGSEEENLNQQVNNFLQGDGEGTGDGSNADTEIKGQGAEGQGQGAGGEAALGEDQSPDTQRKRGLMLQALIPEENKVDENKTPSTLLKNLSEGSIMGNNLLDALALGAGVLYAIYAPKALDSGKKGWKSMFNRFRNKTNGGFSSIPEKNVLSIFAMKMPNGDERLIAARVSNGGIEVLAQQDLAAGVRVEQPGSDTQVDYGMSQLMSKISGQVFDKALLGPKLRNQSALVQGMAKETQILKTKQLTEKLDQCSASEIDALQQWLNKPTNTPPESSPLYNLLSERQQAYGSELSKEQASMSSLVELSIAIGWSQYKNS